jgi:aspartate/methionine/tyrosine aminotransferase
MPIKDSGLRLAKRLDEVGFSDIVQIRNKVMSMRAEGVQVHALHGGEPYFETPDEIKFAAVKALVENQTHYAPSSGLPALRKALVEKLAAKNQMNVTTDEVIATVGGSQALYGAFQSVLDPGDDALVFSPYWTPIGDLVTGAQARPLLVPTSTARRNGIRKTLEQFSTPKTRAVYYNTPQNPSGLVFTRAEAEEVAAFAIERDLIVIADEAYEDLVYDGDHVSIGSLPGMLERTITCFTFSKTYGMTGWRAGYAVAQEPFMTALRKIVLYSTNGVTTPVQHAMIHALKTPESQIAAYRAEYLQRRDLLVAAFNEVGLECGEDQQEQPNGGADSSGKGPYRHHPRLGLRRAGRRPPALRVRGLDSRDTGLRGSSAALLQVRRSSGACVSPAARLVSSRAARSRRAICFKCS